jgi:hypothetical protein
VVVIARDAHQIQIVMSVKSDTSKVVRHALHVTQPAGNAPQQELRDAVSGHVYQDFSGELQVPMSV